MSEGDGDVAVNPDAQTAVTDFLDYTEYLPADLIRSLTLIRGLDETYLTNAYSVHEYTKAYGGLPALSPSARPDPQQLRTKISHHLNLALNARESAYAEASRLFDLADRHQDRLKSIIAKLKALPKPPSRDPTPQPQSASPKRSRSGRKLDGTTRLTLKAPRGPIASGLLPRPRHRRVTVPGEVMPPFDPDEPIASTEVSDWESDEPLPPKPTLKLLHPKPQKLKIGADGVERKAREPRETVSYRKPTPPPADAQVGSKYMPWLELTEYEMFRLRKKMKKNHQWEPSDVMVKRELLEKGRGPENYQKAKAEALAKGLPFLDVRAATTEAAPSVDRTIVPKPSLTLSTTATPVSKAPRKPEPKKEKRPETPKDPASIAAHQAAQAAQKLGNIGSVFANLFSNFKTGLKPSNTPTPNGVQSVGTRPTSEKPPRKRKLAETSTSPSLEPESQQKKQKLVPKPSPLAASIEPTFPATTSKIALKLTVNPQTAATSAASTPLSPSRAASTRRMSSVVPKLESSPQPSTRPPSRRSVATSVEPSSSSSTRPSRRTSTTPGAQIRKTPGLETTPKITATAASQRPKREAPGTVTQASGGVAVMVSKRKHKPSKVNKPARLSQDVLPEVRTDVDGNQEIVDPGEQRYCICKDVSYGDMIMCELEEKCTGGEWFHMECVGLQGLPSRTVKWYCPIDRKKYHKGEATNGLVGRGVKE